MSKALDAIIGETPVMIAVRDVVRRVAPARVAVLIEGPTGAGKELVAAALHEESGRRGKFVPFNVCAIAESVFEDALFGHVRGAFTGAITDSAGFLREADGGTVFMDEIGGLQPSLQPKLLRALETGEFRPLGARSDVRSDFRVVAATNERARDLVAERRLRVDLAHRISAMTIVVPPLIDRLADIPLLVRHFAKRIDAIVSLDDETLAVLTAHAWPGNVRELRNVVECATTLGGLTASTVRSALTGDTPDAAHANAKRQRRRAVLEAHNWNAESVAQALGIHRTTAFRWKRESRPDAPPAP